MLLILTSCPADVAPSLAQTLVTERLAACVNLIPGVQSVYWWEGQVHHDDEMTLLLKTTEETADTLRARLEALHPYDVPEIVTLTPEHVLPSSARWVTETLAQTPDAADPP